MEALEGPARQSAKRQGDNETAVRRGRRTLHQIQVSVSHGWHRRDKSDNGSFNLKKSHTLQTPDGEMLFDFSKNILTEEIMQALLQLVSNV